MPLEGGGGPRAGRKPRPRRVQLGRPAAARVVAALRSAIPALVLAGASLVAACSDDADEAVVPVGTGVGQRPPQLRGTLPTGEPFALEEEQGAPVVLVFFQGAYCGLCRERLARLQEHLESYRSLGVRVVAVAGDPPSSAAALGRRLGIEFPIVSADAATLAAWGAAAAEPAAARPATYVVAREGRIAFRHLGRNAADRATDATLLTVLDSLARR